MATIEKKYPAAERLEQVRLDQGLNQKRFAEELKVSQQAISLYKRKGGMVALAVILRAVERFGVDRDWLTTGVGTMYKDRASETLIHWDNSPSMNLDPKRVRLVELVKKIALDKGTKDKVIDALLSNVEVFADVPKKEEEE